MQYKATAKYLRISTRKVRLVADAIRPLTVDRAIRQLSVQHKRAGNFLKKIIESAVASVHEKGGKGIDSLRFAKIVISEGPSMKRWHAVSKGTAHAYKKRMTHITIVLTDDDTDIQSRGILGGKHGTKN